MEAQRLIQDLANGLARRIVLVALTGFGQAEERRRALRRASIGT